jgi:hypothetical protein
MPRQLMDLLSSTSASSAWFQFNEGPPPARLAQRRLRQLGRIEIYHDLVMFSTGRGRQGNPLDRNQFLASEIRS